MTALKMCDHTHTSESWILEYILPSRSKRIHSKTQINFNVKEMHSRGERLIFYLYINKGESINWTYCQLHLMSVMPKMSLSFLAKNCNIILWKQFLFILFWMVKRGTVLTKEKENAYSTDKVKCEPQSFSLRGDRTNISPWGGFDLSFSRFSLDPKDCELDFFC